MAIEEPEFQVLAETDHYQVRKYQPYVVAEVDVERPLGRQPGFPDPCRLYLR